MDLSDFKYKIFYYCKDKLYNLMLTICKEALSKFSNDISLHFYHALALSLCSRYQESIRELESLQLENDIKLATSITLMYTNKLLGTNDKDVFNKLEMQVREYRKQTNGVDYYNTAFVMFAFRKFEKSYDYIEKSLGLMEDSDNINLKGWILLNLYYLSTKKDADLVKTFEDALQRNSRNVCAALGLAQSYLIVKDKETALNTVNKAVVRFPNLILPLVEKARILFSLQEWEQTSETVNRIFQAESNNLEALLLNALITINKDANYEEGSVLLKKYFLQLEKFEPRNCAIFIDNAVLFSRLCGRNLAILTECYYLVEKSVQIHPNNTEYITELGFQNYLLGKTKEAMRLYKSATKINDSSVTALIGMTLCEMAESSNKEHARQQVEFLVEFQENVSSPILLFMQAKVTKSSEEAINFLSTSYEYQLKELKSYSYGTDYLRSLNPDFLLELVKELVNHAPQSTNLSGINLARNASTFDLTAKILKTVAQACPGLKEALFMLAKVQFLKSEYSEAATTLQHIINDIDITFIDAYILLSQIQIKMQLYDRAAQNLEVALSHNFKVRENPNYHLIIGLIEKNRGNLDEAVKAFNTALTLANKGTKKDENLSLFDKVTIYSELIDVHLQLKQFHEATKLMQEAATLFEGTSEQARIVILNADHAVSNKNVQHAIDLLSKIKSDEPYYLEAKAKLANIYLQHRRDKRAYLQCYHEIVANTGAEGLVSLGDAYMQILEPDLAIEAYQKALNINPKDPFLTSKMGAALVNTHHFARAIKYYKETIEMTGNPSLKIDLVELYILLKQYENAEQLINEEIEAEKDKKLDDLTTMRYRTKLLMLMAEVLEKSGKYKLSQNKLKEARDNQNRIRRLFTMEQTGQ